ncbi:MAG: response regulator transcription factor [Xanthobacteraceae bacterium]
MNAKPLVHIVDDDASLRIALTRLLNAAGFETMAYASTGEFLLSRVETRHGCLLLDVRLPNGPSGLDLHAALREQGVDLPAVFMTGHADVPSCVNAMKAGAVDFLEKPVKAEVLLEAIGRALAGDLVRRAARNEEMRLKILLASLSQRERQVFERVVAGKLNKQIADELGIAERTVKAQRAHMMEKLDAGSTAELGRIAERFSQMRDETTAK